ncbi:MAG: DUF3568 family protein [Phycisphaerales bacterium]
MLISLATGTSGCLAVAVGAGAAGTVAYMAGDMDTQEPYSIEETYVAARAAADELGLNVIEGETGKDALSARVVARDTADKRISIRLKAVTSNMTKLSIRVGTFGDDTKTHLIYNTIRKNLKALDEESAGLAQSQEPQESQQSQDPQEPQEPTATVPPPPPGELPPVTSACESPESPS